VGGWGGGRKGEGEKERRREGESEGESERYGGRGRAIGIVSRERSMALSQPDLPHVVRPSLQESPSQRQHQTKAELPLVPLRLACAVRSKSSRRRVSSGTRQKAW
jgi:hypothetical protein